MKMIFNDKSELVIESMSKDLYRDDAETKAIRIEIDKVNIDEDNVNKKFTLENLTNFQFVNDMDTISYANYKLSGANLYMDTNRASITVTILPN
jgi:hypothetical protein